MVQFGLLENNSIKFHTVLFFFEPLSYAGLAHGPDLQWLKVLHVQQKAVYSLVPG